jgi:hypothetical protein
MTTLKIQPFKNRQTGNTAEMVIDGDGLCTQYVESCAHGTVKAWIDDEETFWATWTPRPAVYPTERATCHTCLDDVLSGLEVELEAKDGHCPWRSDRTGF